MQNIPLFKIKTTRQGIHVWNQPNFVVPKQRPTHLALCSRSCQASLLFFRPYDICCLRISNIAQRNYEEGRMNEEKANKPSTFPRSINILMHRGKTRVPANCATNRASRRIGNDPLEQALGIVIGRRGRLSLRGRLTLRETAPAGVRPSSK